MGLIKKIHKKVYDEIDAALPSQSQCGKVILITGATGGIGFAIARAFAIANASHLVLLGRNEARLVRTVQRLKEEVPSYQGQASIYVADLANPESLEHVWKLVLTTVTAVHVLILNAASMGEGQSILQHGWRQLWEQYEVNVRGNLVLVDLFVQQKSRPQKSNRKYIVNLTSDAINNYEALEGQRPYAATKVTWTGLLQHLALEYPVDQVQIVNMHPGGVYTETVKKVLPKEVYDWDDDTLPGNFAVWASTEQAAFLHGRYCWAGWDVEEMQRVFEHGKKLTSHEFLRVGVVGVDDQFAPASSL